MKQLLHLCTFLVVLIPALLFSQNPCRTGTGGNGNNNINSKFLSAFRTENVDITDQIRECFTVRGNDDVSLTLNATTSSEGPLLSIVVYEDESPNAVDGEVLFPGDAFTFEFQARQKYGVNLQFLGTGTFAATIDGFNPAFDGTYFISVVGAAPVSWSKNLTYEPYGENIQFAWSVTDQVDVAGYELQKLDLTLGFQTIERIAYRENGALEVDYTAIAPWPQESAYYRIKQSDHDGTTDYSNIVFVEGNDAAVQQFSIFPNPASATVRMSVPEGINTVDLISASGQVVKTFTANEVRREGMDVSSVSPGMYLVRPVGENGAATPQRLVVNH